jgi:cell division protein FtsB
MNDSMAKFLTQLYHALILVMGGYLANEFSKVSDSIQSLNQNMAVLIERTTVQNARIDRLEKHIFKEK